MLKFVPLSLSLSLSLSFFLSFSRKMKASLVPFGISEAKAIKSRKWLLWPSFSLLSTEREKKRQRGLKVFERSVAFSCSLSLFLCCTSLSARRSFRLQTTKLLIGFSSGPCKESRTKPPQSLTQKRIVLSRMYHANDIERYFCPVESDSSGVKYQMGDGRDIQQSGVKCVKAGDRGRMSIIHHTRVRESDSRLTGLPPALCKKKLSC